MHHSTVSRHQLAGSRRCILCVTIDGSVSSNMSDIASTCASVLLLLWFGMRCGMFVGCTMHLVHPSPASGDCCFVFINLLSTLSCMGLHCMRLALYERICTAPLVGFGTCGPWQGCVGRRVLPKPLEQQLHKWCAATSTEVVHQFVLTLNFLQKAIVYCAGCA